MSEKNLYYTRNNLIDMGQSKVQVFELESGKCNTINISNNFVDLEPIYVPGFKSYVFIEKYADIDLTTIDVIYGNLDISELKNNRNLRKKLFDEILTRENLVMISKKYCGVIPRNVFKDVYGKMQFDYPRDETVNMAKAIISAAYLEDRETSIKMNNNAEGNNRSFWDMLFGKKKNEKKTETKINPPSTTIYKRNEGVLFYMSGAIVLDDKLYFKFNYATKDKETGIQTKVDNFVISSFDIDKLKSNLEFRKNFVNEVLTPSRLKNARNVEFFPFIGTVDELGHFENDLEAWTTFDKLNSKYNRTNRKALTFLLILYFLFGFP